MPQGKEILANGDVYQGEYECDERVSLTLNRQHFLDGTDESGKRIHLHTASLECSRALKADLAKFTYEGESIPSDLPDLRLEGRLRHGLGEIRYDCGNTYSGGWENDKRSGQGKYAFACGDIYEGQWKDGKYEGAGKYTSAAADGFAYEGQWKADAMEGFGKYTSLLSGDIFEGMFVGGVREGQGKETTANGEVHEGEWKAGERVEA